MTATTLENGLRARLHSLARGSVVLAVALGLCATGASGTAAVAETNADAPAVELFVSAGVRGTVAPGTGTTASVTVENDATSRLSSGRVTVEISRTPLTGEDALTAWLEDDESAGTFDELGTDTTAPVDADSSVSSNVFVPPEALADLAPGIYPLRASLSDATIDNDQTDVKTVTSSSVLVVSAAAVPPVAVIVPVTATPASGALLSPDELSALTAPDGDLTAVLEGVAGTSAILAIDPSIPAAIRSLGSTAPEQAREWLSRLDALPNERFTLQFGDADITTQAQAGLGALLQPTTLTPFLNPDAFTAAPIATPTPTSSPTPSPTPTDGPVLPDDATLTAVEGSVSGILWPRSDLTTQNLATFSAYLGEDATTIVSSSVVEGATGARATVDGRSLLVTDAPSSSAFSRAANAAAAPLRQQRLAEASAHLQLSALANPTAPILIGLTRDDTRSADALRDVIASVDTPGFALESLLAAPATTTTLTATPDGARGASLQRMLDDEVVLAAFGTILEDPQVLLSPKRIQIMRATAVGLGADGFDEAVSAVHTATSDTLDAVDIPQASTIQLLSANADLPFSVRNDLPWPVSVRLLVEPNDTRLDVEPEIAATIPAGTTSRVKVPVSARVASGEVTLRLTLLSPTGVQIGPQESVRVSVRAEWETIGLAGFGGLIVLLLGLGIIRTVRRRRRERDSGEKTDAADDGRVLTEESNE